ncbi:mannose-6-phosphate isomerase, class I [Bacillus sp. AFS002410]|uniref:mannose-6-phosphate isomerase, class I n=1 Tax=Bacillus sp. AFS002410 TaxID=2033481 RepID=UPI0015CF50F0|nr:mannose-6-phosphate isomerase, class I [Bacillus sp. AFS002410]
MQPLFLKPVFKERIWGGTALKTDFNYEIPNKNTGECWAISAHPHGASIIENGPFAGTALNELWTKQPELFGHPKEQVFPLLTKILDANMDLSVQVHPEDTYAKINENGDLGKTECWYILDCKEDADMIFGHNAKSKDELINQIKKGEWSHLLRRVKIKPGDFFYVPSGTIHALCEGTLVLETQQSSDTTYRVYDYDRKDQKGNVRELHLDKAIDVTTVPHKEAQVEFKTEQKENIKINTFVDSEFFTVHKWDITGEAYLTYNDQYLLLSVIKGNGKLIHSGEEYHLTKGSNFIIPVGFGEFVLDGDCEIIVSHT